MIEYESEFYAVRGGTLKKSESGDLYGFSYTGEIIEVESDYIPPKKIKVYDRFNPSVYECAFIACMAHYRNGDNDHSRNMLRWLASKQFKEIWDCVPVSAWIDKDASIGLTGNRFLDQMIEMSEFAARKTGLVPSKNGRSNRAHADYRDITVFSDNQSSASALGAQDLF